MAQQPSSGRPQQEQDQNAPEAGQAPEQFEPVAQEVSAPAPEQQAAQPELSGSDSQGREDEQQSQSPGWTDRESMEHQQRSALDYNEWVNERYEDRNAGLENQRENPVSEPSTATQELGEGNQEQTDRLQQARDLMNAVNDRLEQGQELQSEKVIGD